MKKIILYGVRHIELRRDIEYFLDGDYEISGYSDTWYTSDILDGKRFIPPEELSSEEFDYIIPLSFKETVLADMEAILRTQGIPSEKIIRPVIFLHQGAEKMQVDLIRDIKEQYHGEEGLLFGLSYSLRGIFEKKLCPAFYDCSWHGLDLYYNYRIFQYMRNQGFLSTVKTALLVFPYYYFNLDMSKSAYHYRMGYMFALRGLDDWHNYQQTPDAYQYVANYRMFGRKISDFYHFHKYEQRNRAVYQGKDGEADLRGVWRHIYPETVAENAVLYTKFCLELAEEGITPILVIPPYYTKGLNQAAREAVKQMKHIFYQTAGHQSNIFDFFDIFANRRELFVDVTHLNSDGAEEFTKIINEGVFASR